MTTLLPLLLGLSLGSAGEGKGFLLGIPLPLLLWGKGVTWIWTPQTLCLSGIYSDSTSYLCIFVAILI